MTHGPERTPAGRGTGAAVLAKRLRTAPARSAGIPRAPRDAGPVLSFSQQRLWTVDRLRPGGTDYLVSLALDLRGPLDVDALSWAIDELVARHEILRTRYPADAAGRPIAVLEPPAPVALPVVDATVVQVPALVVAERDQPFDIGAELVLRARLARIGADAHVLVLVAHHIAVDGWSIGVLAGELGRLYAAATGAAAPPLQPALQYRDVAAWQRDRMSGPRLAQGISRWRDRLAGVAPLELPADRPRPPVWDDRGDTVGFTIPAATAARAAELALAHRATPFMFYTAAFWAVLARYTGQDDVAVGSPVSDRAAPGTENVLGDLVNMVVLRGDVAGDPAFTELLDQARERALDAFSDADVPFAAVVDELVTGRDLSANPLFQVSFGMQQTEPVRFAAGELTGTEITLPSASAKFDQTWTLEPQPDGAVLGEVTFATALFDRSSVTRLATHYVRLLEAALVGPRRRIGDLAVLDDDELALLVRPAQQAVDPGPCLHERFAAVAAATPDAVAVIDGDTTLTYAELLAAAGRLAHRLRGLGIGRESLVGVCLPRSADLVVAILATVSAGGAYLPLDPAHPAERLAGVLADAGATVLVTDATGTDLAGGLATVRLDDPAETARLAELPATAPDVAAHPDDLAYVIYTSGSTGRPKGVQITHANVGRLLVATEPDFAFGPDDVWSLFHSASFDMSVWEMWGALLHGGRLVVVPVETTRSPWDLVELLAGTGVTVLNQTPSAFRMLVELAGSGDPAMDRLALRVVTLGGEAVDVGTLEPWWRRFGDAAPRIVNMYGITETTVHVTVRPLGLADLGGDRSPVGGPMRDLAVHVLDPRSRPLPIGVAGELCVGGPGVSRGYRGRPRLTAERFVPDPYGTPGARLYRSGDKARTLPDGDLGYLGRFDHQVKIRGFRIELGEIETCLSAAPDVEHAVVVVDTSTRGDRRLVGYVVPAAGTHPDAARLRADTARTLPSYMVPAVIVVIPRLPLTVNGKLDRAALPRPDEAAAVPAAAPAVATSTVERELAAVWSATLEIPRPGVDESFFALGGDSILAIRLVAALRDAGWEVSVADLFTHQTIAALAAHVRPAGSERAAAPAAPFALVPDADRPRLPAGLADAYPMSMVQVGMIAELVADPELNLYHNITSYLVRDPGGLDAAALRDAAALVVGRHEVLRTAFDPTTYSTPMQLVHRDVEVPVPVADLRDRDRAAQDRQLDAFRARERAHQVDLAVPPLLRWQVHRTAEDRWVLHFTECHAILDGWSHNSLVTELLDTYRALRDGKPVPLRPRGTVRFAELIGLERDALDDPAHRGFWASRLDDADRAVLPAGWADPDGEPFFEHAVTVGDLDAQVRALADATGASRRSVLLAAHIAVWRAVAGDDPFLLATVVNSRPEVDGGDAVRGMFLNTLPFAAPTAAGTWRELVRQVFAEELAVWPHRRYPLPALQRSHGAGDRLIEISFNYIDFHVLDRDAVDVAGSVDVSPNEFPLVISTEPGLLVLSGQSRRIGRARVEALAVLYRTALYWHAGAPDTDPRAPLRALAARSGLVADDAARARIAPGTDPGVPAAAGGRPAAGTTEQMLAAVWADELGITERGGTVGAEDDYFALGGQSLQLMRIILVLRERHRIRLTFRDVVEHRTVAGIAAALAAPHRPRSPLVWLDRVGDRPPLYCVHPGGGSAHWYRGLAARLRPDRPVGAFEWPGLTGDPTPVGSVEEVADRYLAALDADHPGGPVHLLGWCGGGGITWELARRLTARGDDVRLVLLDPVAVLPDGSLPGSSELATLVRAEELLTALDAGPLPDTDRAELGTVLREIVEDDHGVPIRDADIGADWLPRVRTWRALQEAERAYRFEPYVGGLDLIVCAEMLAGQHVAGAGVAVADYLEVWPHLVGGGYRVHEVPGDHLGVLAPPHVDVLATTVAGLLAEES